MGPMRMERSRTRADGQLCCIRVVRLLSLAVLLAVSFPDPLLYATASKEVPRTGDGTDTERQRRPAIGHAIYRLNVLYRS